MNHLGIQGLYLVAHQSHPEVTGRLATDIMGWDKAWQGEGVSHSVLPSYIPRPRHQCWK